MQHRKKAGSWNALHLVARAVLALAALMTAPALALAQVKTPRETRPPLVLDITGDLLYMKTADDVRARLAKAEDERRPVVAIDLNTRRSRPDVVLELARAIRASKVPVAVRISDGDLDNSTPSNQPVTVGAGPLAIGLAAKWCIARPNIIFGPKPDDFVRDLAPDSADRETVDEQLHAEVAASLQRRRVAEDVSEPLARAILNPREPLEMAWTGCPTTLRVLAADAPESDRPVAPEMALTIARAGPDGTPAMKIDLPTARQLGWVDAESLDITEWLRKEQTWGRAINREKITPDTAKLPRIAADKLPIIDGHIETAEKLLDLPDPEKRTVSKDKYKEAAKSALAALTKGEASLSATEKLLNDYPEVLRTPPPGQTAVAAKPSSYAAKWRSMIQSRRDKLAKLRAKAEEFAAP